MQTTQAGRSRPSGTSSQNDQAYGRALALEEADDRGVGPALRAEKAVEVEAVDRQVPEQEQTDDDADQAQRGRVGGGEEEGVPGRGRPPARARPGTPPDPVRRRLTASTLRSARAWCKTPRRRDPPPSSPARRGPRGPARRRESGAAARAARSTDSPGCVCARCRAYEPRPAAPARRRPPRTWPPRSRVYRWLASASCRCRSSQGNASLRGSRTVSSGRPSAKWSVAVTTGVGGGSGA